MPEGVPFYEGQSPTGRWSSGIIDQQGIGAIMHFAGSIVVPESVEKPLDYYREQHARQPRADQRRGGRGRPAHAVFVDRRGLWRAANGCRSAKTIPKLPINPYGASKLMTERMLADASAAH